MMALRFRCAPAFGREEQNHPLLSRHLRVGWGGAGAATTNSKNSAKQKEGATRVPSLFIVYRWK
jgi:hypothetical protein